MASRGKLRPTPESTVGPFFPGAFVDRFSQDLTIVAPAVVHRPEGQPISVTFRFVDAAGKPVPSVIVEVWQANGYGRYRHPADQSESPLDPHFDGFARLRSGDDGACTLRTIKPGARKSESCVRAPHLRLTIFASGIDRLTTQVFFEDEPLNASDTLLMSIADENIQKRLLARRLGYGAYEIDIVFRGAGETPFFDDLEDF